MSADSRGTTLILMDAAFSSSVPRVEADVRIGGNRQDFALPVWQDGEGDIRIALPKFDPEHGTDHDQVIFDVSDLIIAIGKALEK